MRKYILITLLCTTLLFCGCKHGSSKASISTNIANPFVSCVDIEEGIEKSGIPIDVSDNLGDFTLDSVQIKENELLQLSYRAGDYNLFLRKGYFDIEKSGDYTKYDISRTLVINGIDVKLGINDEYIYNAVWQNDSYSYLLISSAGLTEDSFARLIMQID